MDLILKKLAKEISEELDLSLEDCLNFAETGCRRIFKHNLDAIIKILGGESYIKSDYGKDFFLTCAKAGILKSKIK